MCRGRAEPRGKHPAKSSARKATRCQEASVSWAEEKGFGVVWLVGWLCRYGAREEQTVRVGEKTHAFLHGVDECHCQWESKGALAGTGTGTDYEHR